MTDAETERPTSLREQLLQAGAEVLDRDGLILGPASITYARVFEHLHSAYDVRVTRASVHERIWASHDDFRFDVLRSAISHIPAEVSSAETRVFLDIGKAVLNDDLDGPARLKEFSRLAGQATFDATLDSAAMANIQATKILAFYTTEPDSEIRQLLAERVDRLTTWRAIRFARVAGMLGLRPRAQMGMEFVEAAELFYLMAIHLTVGGYLNVKAGCDDFAQPQPVAVADGRVWTGASLGVYALIRLLFEPDPTGNPASSIDLVATESIRRSQPLDRTGDSRRRRTREELQELVLAAGTELLLRDGLDLRPESLGYATVFAHMEAEHGKVVHRSSVHKRLWDSNEDYWLDVLATCTDPNPPPTNLADETTASLAASAAGPLTNVATANAIIHTFVDGQIDALLAMPNFVRLQLVKASLANQATTPAVEKLRQRVHGSHRTRVERIEAVLRATLLGGFKARPELGMSNEEAVRTLSLLAATSSTGAVLDRMAGLGAGSRLFSVARADDPATIEAWTSPALAVRAFFDLLFVPADG